MKIIVVFVVELYILIVGFSCATGTKSERAAIVYSPELETELRRHLFSGYEVLQRPEKVVRVRTSLNLLSLNYLDIKEQKLSVTAYFYFEWPDSRLRWIDNSTYDNVIFLFSNDRYIWKPAIIVENSVDDIDVLSRPNVPMRIKSLGVIAWMPAGIFTTHCESTITYWPLDSQTCDIILSSWAYTANEVALEFDLTAILTTFYQENGEWELIAKTHSTAITTREFERFSRLIFTLKFRRRPLFHMLSTLFPVFLMGFLTVAIFKLSPESGERVGLALTILLAYAVYLGLISESIPQTSVSTSLLSTYLASILFLQTLAVFLTVIYLDIYLTSPDKVVPRWMQSFASSFLSKLACVDCCRKSTKISEQNTDKNIQVTSIEDQNGEKKDKTEAWVGKDFEEGHNSKEYSWKEIALLLDKMTMYVYLILVTLITVVFLIVMLYHFQYAYSVI